MDGIIDLISCCAGIAEKGNVTPMPDNDPESIRNLGRTHEDLRDKLKSPSQYSINELTNAMDRFLDECRQAMQQLSHEI